MIKCIISISFLSVTFLTNGQSTAKTEVEIRKLEQAVVKAILNADTNTLKEFWAPEFMVNNPRNEVSPNRDAILQIQRAGMIDYSSFEKVNEQIQF